MRVPLCLLLALGCAHEAREAQVVTREAAARVRIAALMPNPRVAPDERGEWIALRNDGERVASLDGWRLDSANDPGFPLPRGVRIAAGGTLVLARSIDRGENGGVEASIALTGITLGNRADWLVLRDGAGRTVDSLGWSSTRPGEPVTGTPAQPTSNAARTTASAPDTTSALLVHFLDVGQGDAILVRDGRSLALIDGGADAALLGRRLDALGLGRDTTFDVVVLTHPHADHYQGLHELFRSGRRLAVRYFIETGDPSPQVTLRRLRDSVGARVRRGATIFRDADDPCANGSAVCTFTMRGGARLQLLRPDPRGGSVNDRSVAVKIVARDSGVSMLLAGDSEQGALRFLESSYGVTPGLDVDLLKANHHGSCDGVSARFLRLTSPDAVVASLAARNDYGHVHTRTKELLRGAAIPWYRTDQNGEVTVRVPGDSGARYGIVVERGSASVDGPSDRGARCE